MEMFGILKNKISNFVNKLTKKEEEKPEQKPIPKEEPNVEKKPVEKVEEKKEVKKPEVKKEEPKIKKPVKEIPKKPEPIVKEIEKPEIKIEKERPKPIPKVEPKTVKEEPKKKEIKPEIKKEIKPIEPLKIETKAEEIKVPEQKPKEIKKEKPVEIKKPEPVKEIPKIEEKPIEIKEEIKPVEEKPKEKKGMFDQLKGLVLGKPEEKLKKIEPKIEIKEEPEEIEDIIEEVEKPVEIPKKEIEIKAPEKPKEKKPKVKIGMFDQLKSVVTGEVEIKKEDISELLEEFELGLLEGDVALEVAEEMKNLLEQKLIGKKIKKNELSKILKQEMENVLFEIMEQKQEIDFVDFVKNSEKPVKIMFLGINGAGKTTTLAKIAHMLQKNNLKVVFAAADTFRAAAIEQIGVHADKLGVKVIKRPYGSDSTAVVYDAVNYAKAHEIDAVLIDTAGRQDTNVDLINELKKMERVTKPDLKVYIGESIAGNAIVDQVGSFNKEIGLNGVILTKIDCDPKGGTIISISKTTGLPILYITNGQTYEDIEKFDPGKIIKGLVE